VHIAIDHDDVLADFTGGLRRAVQTEYGVVVPEFVEWDISVVLDPILGEPWWGWLQRRDWLWANFPAVEGAIGTLELLRKDGHYLEIVTHKPRWAEASVFKWLGLWRPPVHRVTIVDPSESKLWATNADLLVDDKVENCQEFWDAGRHAILFDRPHNRKAKVLATSQHRAASWSEVRRLLTPVMVVVK
jgi:5'(3')-deoxyribonucleotidase